MWQLASTGMPPRSPASANRRSPWSPPHVLLLVALASVLLAKHAACQATGSDEGGTPQSVRTAHSSEELHAALADPDVSEVLVTSRLLIAPPVFSASPERQLDLKRKLTIRGTSPEAGLWTHRTRCGDPSSQCDDGVVPLDDEWLRYHKFLTLHSLRLENLVVLTTEITYELMQVGQGALFGIQGGKRLDYYLDYSLPRGTLGGLSLRNCSVDIGLLDSVPAVLDESVTATVFDETISYAGLTGLRSEEVKLEGNSGIQVPVLSPREASMAALEILRLMLVGGFQLSSSFSDTDFDVESAFLYLWGPNKLHMFYYWSYGFRIVDSSITMNSDTMSIVPKDIVEFVQPGSDSEDLESFRTAMLTYRGEKNAECQSIYAPDTAFLASAAEAGIDLPQSFSRPIGGRDYEGPMNRTASGRPCVPWRDITHLGAEEEFGDIEGNACRWESRPCMRHGSLFGNAAREQIDLLD